MGRHGLSFAPVQAEQAHPAQRGSQKSTQIELGSGTETQAPEKQTAQMLRHEHRDPRAQMQFYTAHTPENIHDANTDMYTLGKDGHQGWRDGSADKTIG